MTQTGTEMRLTAKQQPYGSAPQEQRPFCTAGNKKGKRHGEPAVAHEPAIPLERHWHGGSSMSSGTPSIHTQQDRLRVMSNSGCRTYHRTEQSSQLVK